MAFLDDGKKIAAGAAIGVGLILLAPVLGTMAARFGRPLFKAAVKQGIQFAEQGRVTVAEAVETVEDLVAEVRSELAHAGAEPAADRPGAERKGAGHGAKRKAGKTST